MSKADLRNWRFRATIEENRALKFETTENVLFHRFETSTQLIQNDQNISKLYTYNILLDIATNPNVQGPIVWLGTQWVAPTGNCWLSP